MLMGCIPVKVSPHRTLNSRKFVIKCQELDNMEEEDIKEELKPKGLIAVKRILVHYSLYVMTIKGQDVPEKINIGHLKKETRPYIPMPKIWTHQNSCKGKAVCAGRGEEGHNVDDCQNDPKCVNCEGDHRAISKDCPIWKQQKDIVTLKYKENISFADGRKRVQPISDPSKNSYATVTQTPPQSARPLQPWARNIRPPNEFQTEVQFLKYILNYCLTRLDAIGNVQIPVHHTAATEDPIENIPTINTHTVLNNNTAASNDENNVDMAYVATSATAMKRSVDDDSSDEESRPNAKKMSAASSPASKRPDTAVSKEREGRDLPRISTFPSAPKPGEQRANRRSLSPIHPPSFTGGGGSSVEVLTTIIKSHHHHQDPNSKKVM